MKLSSIAFFSFCLFFVKQVTAQQVFTNMLGMKFVLTKPGHMTMGRFQPAFGKVDFNGRPLPEKVYAAAMEMAQKDAMMGFRITISKGYYIGMYEVTQAQWEKVMDNNPSVFKNDTSANKPVENITWSDAQEFVKKLSAMDKKYSYRLPTEFEWEYAARAGAQDDISWKDIRASSVLSGGAPSAGGTKQPNAWGIYDMLGNVWEWVEDFYNEKIFADPVPPKSGQQHVLKGASFTSDVKNATYMTHAAGPGNGFDVGLRIVMEMKKQVRGKK